MIYKKAFRVPTKFSKTKFKNRSKKITLWGLKYKIFKKLSKKELIKSKNNYRIKSKIQI